MLLHSSLGNRVRLHLKTKRKKVMLYKVFCKYYLRMLQYMISWIHAHIKDRRMLACGRGERDRSGWEKVGEIIKNKRNTPEDPRVVYSDCELS